MNMNSIISGFDTYQSGIDRFLVHQRFHEDPLKGIGKWMLGIVVYLAYMGAIPLVLFLWYYYIFLPWKDK